MAIADITEPDGDAVATTITFIRQDEAVNAKGDDNTATETRGSGTAPPPACRLSAPVAATGESTTSASPPPTATGAAAHQGRERLSLRRD